MEEADFRLVSVETIVARGRLRAEPAYTLQPVHTPDTVLGCWVTNTSFSGTPSRRHCDVTGKFDIHVWYSYDHMRRSEVITHTVTFHARVPLRELGGERSGEDERCFITITVPPHCVDVDIRQGALQVTVRFALVTDVFGHARLCVHVYPNELAETGEKKDLWAKDDLEKEW